MSIEQNICGHEMGDNGEFFFGSSGTGGVPGSGIHTIQAGGRPGSGSYFYRTIPGILAGNPYFSFFPAGSVVGTSGTVASGDKKRARVRVYVRIESQSFSFAFSQGHVFGFGTEAGTAGVWVDGDRHFGVRAAGSAVSLSTSTLELNVWYQFTLDVLLDVSADTLVTATLTVQSDSEAPEINETVVATANIGATDALDQLGVGQLNPGVFGIHGTYSFDDWVWQATSNADAVAAIELPSATHIRAIVPPTGFALNQWETGTYTDVDEYPMNGADSMSSILGDGTEVEFIHASGIGLGLGAVQAMKSYANCKIAGGGTGAIELVLNGIATARTATVDYPADTSAYNPNGGVLFQTLTSAQFSATTFGVKKQNGTQQTFIANIGLEVLGLEAEAGEGTQIRGETQIKAGSVYDGQIADDAAIQRHKIQGLGLGPAPIFFGEESAGGGDEGLVVPGPAGAAGAAGAAGVAGAPGGALVLLASLSAAASASLDFTARNAGGQSGALFQSDFDEYLVEFVGLQPATDSVGIRMRMSTDGGSSWASGASDYRWSFMAYGSGGPGNTNSTAATFIELIGFANLTNTVERPLNGFVRVFNPLSSAAYKMVGGHFPYWDATPTLVTGELVGAYQSTTAVNAIQFFCSSGNITTGTIRVYGIDKNGTALSGRVVQVVNTQTGAVATGSTTIPFDDTIPQNTEGTEFVTLPITPRSAANKLRIEVTVFCTVTSTPWIIVALFQDAVADALATIASFNNLSTAGMAITLVHTMDAGTTSATTFKVRIGPSSAATVTFNGQSGGRIFGGRAASSITITEYTP